MLLGRVLTLSASAALHLAALGLWVLGTGIGASSAILVDLVAEVAGEAVDDTRPSASRRPSGAVSAPPAPARAHAAVPLLRRRAEVAPRSALVQSVPTTAAGEPAAEPDTAVEARTPRTEAPTGGGAPPPVPSGPTDPPEPIPRLSGSNPSPQGAGTVEDGRVAMPGDDGGVSPAGTTRRASGDSLREPGAGSESSGGGPAVARARDGRGGIPPEYAPKLQHFRRRVQESLEYPLVARRRGLSGRLELEVLLEPSGRLGDIRVMSSSAHAVLDEAAVEAVRKLAPEPLPEHLPRRSLRIRLPLSFELE